MDPCPRRYRARGPVVQFSALCPEKSTSCGAGPAQPAQSGAEPMVACRQCGVHLPQHEALPGRGGVFCGEAHRAEYEKQHPAG